jgi:hypothetical protein
MLWVKAFQSGRVLAAAAVLLAQLTAGVEVQLTVADGLIEDAVSGRVVVLFAPSGVDPLEDYDVTSTPDLIFGKTVHDVTSSGTISMSGGGADNVLKGVWGFPNSSLDDVPVGDYSVQAFLMPYERVTRADGSIVDVHFPCGDGAPNIDGVGSLSTAWTNVTVENTSSVVELSFDSITEAEEFNGTEIGGCSQGNYLDTDLLKYVKIRSEVLSDWWGRDMYVGANVLLPFGYDADDTDTMYPTIYYQGHWPGERGAFSYPTANFSEGWDVGTILGEDGEPDRPAPKLIMVTFRHETPYYDDSYAVNTANIGPWGDAINDELIPHLESMFNMIPEPYARMQVGGSTGGWESIANVIFRPDMFGICFSNYPDSLSFNRHQDIQLYTNENAYVNADGDAIPSIREVEDGKTTILATVELENHWELSFGTLTRSFLQWDVWNAVFGVQSVYGFPLEPWNKVSGEIYPDSVEYWRHMDMADYIVSNWDNERNLGETLKGRIFVYVGLADDYYLNEGVAEFQKLVEAKGGAGWANFTYLEGQPHGGNYQRKETWDFIEFAYQYFVDMAPDGENPLSSEVTQSSSRGNTFEEVMAYGGHQAALARQAPPTIDKKGWKSRGVVSASVGRWDPGVDLEAQWIVNGKPSGEAFEVESGATVTYDGAKGGKWSFVQLKVTGSKYGKVLETRTSEKCQK